jgi:hypothetical protein
MAGLPESIAEYTRVGFLNADFVGHDYAMTLLALKGEVSSFCEVWILCGSIPPINKI